MNKIIIAFLSFPFFVASNLAFAISPVHPTSRLGAPDQIQLDAANGVAAVVERLNTTSRVQLYDVHNPKAMQPRGNISSDVSNLITPRLVTVKLKGSKLYVTYMDVAEDDTSYELFIYDVSNLAAPKQIGNLVLNYEEGETPTSPVAINNDKIFALNYDENSSDTDINVYQFSASGQFDPNPIYSQTVSAVTNLTAANNALYVADPSGNVTDFDITNPSNWHQVNYYPPQQEWINSLIFPINTDLAFSSANIMMSNNGAYSNTYFKNYTYTSPLSFAFSTYDVAFKIAANPGDANKYIISWLSDTGVHFTAWDPKNPALLTVGQTFIGNTSLVTVNDLCEANQVIFVILNNIKTNSYSLAAYKAITDPNQPTILLGSIKLL